MQCLCVEALIADNMALTGFRLLGCEAIHYAFELLGALHPASETCKIASEGLYESERSRFSAFTN